MSVEQIRALNTQLSNYLQTRALNNIDINKLIRNLKVHIYSLPSLPTQPPEVIQEASIAFTLL